VEEKRKKITPLAAFIPIGLGLIALGISTNTAFIGAGALFVMIGVVNLVRHRKSQIPQDEEH